MQPQRLAVGVVQVGFALPYHHVIEFVASDGVTIVKGAGAGLAVNGDLDTADDWRAMVEDYAPTLESRVFSARTAACR